jgi:hypothetical protein
MEHGDMTSEKRSDRLAAPEPEDLKDPRLPPRPPPQSRPPITNDGLELPRSSQC